MNDPNPPTKSIDIKIQDGLNLLKIKAKYYGYYAENLKVMELIEEIEQLRQNTPEMIQESCYEASRKLGW